MILFEYFLCLSCKQSQAYFVEWKAFLTALSHMDYFTKIIPSIGYLVLTGQKKLNAAQNVLAYLEM